MFEIGCYVIKSVGKVCKVEDIVSLDKTMREYYLLLPIDEKGAKIYVPVERAEASARRVMSKENVMDLIERIPQIEETNIEDERFRERKYKEILASDNPESLVGIIKMLYVRNKERTGQGKKNTVVDQKYYKQAEDSLYAEMSFVLQRERSEIQQMIKNTCEDN